MIDTKKEQEREELHRTIWNIANELRGSVDGWDFKQYVLGMLFYRYISENFRNYINEGEIEAGNPDFDYAKLSDEEAEPAREELVTTKGIFMLPSELFENVKKDAPNHTEDLNEILERIFYNIEHSAQGTDSEDDFKGLFDDIDVNSNVLSKEDLSGLREAVQGVYDIDKSFMALVDYFRKSDEPTLLIMYGDHLPFLGINSSTYRSVGFMKHDLLVRNKNMYETPYVIWANYDISGFDIKERVGAQYLGINAVKMAMVENLPWQFDFFDDFYTNHTVFERYSVCDENGGYTNGSVVTTEETEAYQMVQYDCLFGKENYAVSK